MADWRQADPRGHYYHLIVVVKSGKLTAAFVSLASECRLVIDGQSTISLPPVCSLCAGRARPNSWRRTTFTLSHCPPITADHLHTLKSLLHCTCRSFSPSSSSYRSTLDSSPRSLFAQPPKISCSSGLRVDLEPLSRSLASHTHFRPVAIASVACYEGRKRINFSTAKGTQNIPSHTRRHTQEIAKTSEKTK